MVRELFIVALVVAALGGLTLFAMAQQGASCEACVVVHGQRACRSASAPTRVEAEQHAIATACAGVTGGVTGDLACQRTRPERLRCE